MWLIHRMTVHGLFVGPLLLTAAMPLQRNFRTVDTWSVAEHSSATAQKKSELDLSKRGQAFMSRRFNGQVEEHPSLQPPGADSTHEERVTDLALVSPSANSQLIALHTKSSLDRFEMNLTRVMAFGFFGVVLCGLLAILCSGDETFSARSHDTPKPPPKVEQMVGKKDIPKLSMNTSAKEEISDPPDFSLNTKENLRKVAASQSVGTWAKTYRTADQCSQEALELLCLCKIIPMKEFAHIHVSQEHIDECVWISTQMLRQRSLEEWVKAWPQAKQTFDESVTACFAARTDVIASLYGNSPPNSQRSPRSNMDFMDCGSPVREPGGAPSPAPAQRQSRSKSPGEDPFSTGNLQMGSPQSRSTAVSSGTRLQQRTSPPAESQELRSQDASAARSSVVARCRELMNDAPLQTNK